MIKELIKKVISLLSSNMNDREEISHRLEIFDNNYNDMVIFYEKLSSKLHELQSENKNLIDKVLNLENKLFNEQSALFSKLISDFDYNTWLNGNGCTISELTRIYNSEFLWDSMPHSYWLYLMSSLVEKNEIDTASNILYKYLARYKEIDIDRYLILSSFCIKQGYSNEKIVKSSYVLNCFNKNKNLLKNLLSNKSVALIGNGPSELGKGNGGVIDKFDIVIRFNNFTTNNFEEDYGKKVDIWVRSSAGDDIPNNHDISEYLAVIWEADYDHFPLHYDDLDTLYAQTSSFPDKISNFDFFSHDSLKRLYNIANPSTGLITLFYLVNIAKPSKLGIYGFSFQENNPTYLNEHYFNDRTAEISSERLWNHDMILESKIIKDIIKDCDFVL